MTNYNKVLYLVFFLFISNWSTCLMENRNETTLEQSKSTTEIDNIKTAVDSFSLLLTCYTIICIVVGVCCLSAAFYALDLLWTWTPLNEEEPTES